jgi:uncharacterized protein YfaS (alpha-2-macroglobulin family)
MTPNRFRARTFHRLLLALSFLFPLASVAAEPAPSPQPTALYRHGNLDVALPYRAPHSGTGTLTVELLDPESKVLGRVERTLSINAGDGAWHESLAPAKALALDDLIWQRVHYRFQYDSATELPIEDTSSVSQILERPTVHILGQRTYIAGSRAALRVLVSSANNSAPLSGSLRVELIAPNRTARTLFAGKLNRRGTAEPAFNFPDGLAGKFSLRFLVDTPIGSSDSTQSIELNEKASILLTTEKPLYQPGQTIHIRALALDSASHKADAARKLIFEIEDSKGNKVFKQATATDTYGIASATFTLADEVNLGAYHLRALMGDSESPTNTAELTLSVDRYVLPKFKVAVELTTRDGKQKRDYRPGDHITGTVRANYFYGKPVDHAQVTIKASAIDVALFEAASAKGTTDADGAYRFDLKLPSYFAGKPLTQGAARALIEATVKDSADHAETRGEPITVSAAPLLLTAIPEGGTLIAHIENEVFLLASYPDGSPAHVTLTVQHHGEREEKLASDESGIALYRFTPDESSASLTITADDHRGNRATSTVPLELRAGSDQVLLRTERAVYKPGDRIALTVLSTRTRGTAYVDVIKNGQTILTRDIDIENGRAELSLIATPEMAGTLDLNAYLFGRDAEPTADHRLVFIQPAGELKIEATTDRAEYRPGDDARLRFHVTNARGQGVQAALGLQIVDEAVFALAEKQPGFAKVFFYLEQELMKPRYEIHSLSMPSIVDDDNPEKHPPQPLAALALFAATELIEPAKLDVEFGRELPRQKLAAYEQRYRAAFVNQVTGIAAQLSAHNGAHPSDITKSFAALANGSAPRDSWNTPLRIEPAMWARGRNRFYLVRSAGPDRQFNTVDDLAVYLQERTGLVTGTPNQGGSFDLRIEHDRGPSGNRAEITGTIVDASGAVIPGATITARNLADQSARTTHADNQGRFTLAALPAAPYRIEIASPGFERLSNQFALQARDRAIVSATLQIGAATQSVMVAEESMAMPAPMARAGMGGAMHGMVFAAKADAHFAAVDNMMLESRDEKFLRKDAPEAPPAGPDAPTHVRSWFPEALYINPEILTDGNGNATISIPLADSITTWRMAMLASTQSGTLGTATASLKVFQDFFADLDLPVTITQGDRVSIPVAVYNYTAAAGRVTLNLKQEDWFSLDGDAETNVSVDAGHIGAAQFTINAKRIGKFKLTLTAQMQADDANPGTHQDIVVREIEVVPNGREQNLVFNGRLETSAKHNLEFPAEAIPDATTLFVRLYPGPLSQLVEGMDSILSMPGGCFEQTSSSTYPNVLALDYMKRTKKLVPEVHAKAEGYIANGYQRLLTFEVPGGGFSWFGQAPANKILTAYGLMEFNDMSKVSEVDPRLIARTAAWLASQQQPDGSWNPDTSFINEGATNRFNTDRLRITAYIAWSLANTSQQPESVAKAKQYIEAHTDAKADAYTLAVLANFAVDYAKDRDFTRRTMQALLDARTEKDDAVSWTAQETGVYATGESAAIETTGLATQALLKWGQASEVARKSLKFITAHRQASGAWGTTQATIMALRALVLATELSASDVHGNLAVLLDGQQVETLALTPDNNDLLHQFVLKGIDPQKPHQVALEFHGGGSLAYQIVGRFFTPWDKPGTGADATQHDDPLSIDIAYDRITLAQNDIVTATVTVRNNLPAFAKMIMVDLGIPPGFDLLSEDLQSYQETSANAASGRLEKFSQTATQAILYFNGLAPGQTVSLKFRLRAKYPIRAKTFASHIYEYYDPAVRATAQPVELNVQQH